MSFKDLVLSKEVIVAILSGAGSIFIAILSMKKGKNKPLQKEQLETIYFPIFIILEEVFYRYSEDETFFKIDCQVKCNTIREKNFEAPRRESEN